jgi:hypothetical protein
MDVVSIVLAIGTAIGGGGSAFLWLETRSAGAKAKRTEEIDARLNVAFLPLAADVKAIHAKLDSDNTQAAGVIKAAIHEVLEPMQIQVATLNTKVEPLWAALINMGINQANVLHQPDPRRAVVDKLLEELQEELRGGKQMTADHFLQLQHYLNLIKSWEPGDDIGFPVLPAEPTSAAILLAIMGLSRIRRLQENS